MTPALLSSLSLVTMLVLSLNATCMNLCEHLKVRSSFFFALVLVLLKFERAPRLSETLVENSPIRTVELGPDVFYRCSKHNLPAPYGELNGMSASSSTWHII